MRLVGEWAAPVVAQRVTLLFAFALMLTTLPAPQLERPPIETPIRGAALRAVLRDAHVATFGKAPSRARLSMAVAHVAFEGADRSVAFALGGIDAAPGQVFTRWRNCRLVAHDDHASSARAYFRFMARRCGGALAAFDTGDPGRVADHLAVTKRDGTAGCAYHRLDTSIYSEQLRRLMR